METIVSKSSPRRSGQNKTSPLKILQVSHFEITKTVFFIYSVIKLRCVFSSCLGNKGCLKSVGMMTISESDNWEICSSSGMKYGQFVDWEKIDPEAAERYQKVLCSNHQQLKIMGREGFWAMTHTLRAKAYYHIIHSINSRSAPYVRRSAYHYFHPFDI